MPRGRGRRGGPARVDGPQNNTTSPDLFRQRDWRGRRPRQSTSEVGCLSGRGPRTITSKTALRAQLEDVRHEGLAISDEELIEGSRAYRGTRARRVRGRDRGGGLGGLRGGLSRPTSLVDRFGGALLATGERISRRVGWLGGGGKGGAPQLVLSRTARGVVDVYLTCGRRSCRPKTQSVSSSRSRPLVLAK